MKEEQWVRDKITKKRGQICHLVPIYRTDEPLWVVRLTGDFMEANGRALRSPMRHKIVHRLELDLEKTA